MKKRITSLAFIFVLCVLSVYATDNQFTIKGTIKGKKSGVVELSYLTLKNNKFDRIKLSAVIHQGIFFFQGYLEEPASAYFKVDEIEGELYIEPSAMKLDIAGNDNVKFKLSGSITQRESEQLAQRSQHLLNSYDQLYTQYRKICSKLDSLPESSADRKELLEKKNETYQRRDSINKLITRNEIEFIKSNPNSYYPVISNSIDALISQKQLEIDSARILFNHLSERVRASVMGKFTNTYIEKNENLAIGKIAPDFNTPDMNGQLVKLSDYRGVNYVLLDFWAGWCGPCVQGLPHMRELYKKYHDKGLQIIGISCDRSKDDWLAAIDKHNVSMWPQVSEVQNFEKHAQGYVNKEDINNIYSTDGIPRYILIDKAGVIIKEWEGYSEENEKDQDKLFEEIFMN